MADEPVSAPQWLGRYVERIDSRISGIFGEGDTSLDGVVKEALSGGKRVRAVLALLWCEAISGSYETALPLSVAYELAHAAALVQDDIVDNSDLRRGERSIVNRYGLRAAILASNLLLAQVPREIAEYGTHDPSGETLKKLFELLGESYGASVMGEFMDLEMAERDDADEKQYESMIKLKTGALVGASSASGVIVGGGLGNDELVRAAFNFGECLGMAYQVQDDLLDIVGDEKVLGKPVFSDIRSGKKNVVVIHTFEHCRDDDRRFLAKLLGSGGSIEESQMKTAKELFAEYDSIDYARKVALNYVERAQKILHTLELGPSRSKLIELSEYLAERNY
ncbi:MAG TPA: polyprenyl synthetase family protein [Nitrososphaerales archaeon]|nr:polyprenyl synthetase family protein [Nitrososphaerales archaeon]